MYIFLEQRTEEKNTSNVGVSVASTAVQYNTTHHSSEGTVFFHYVRHFRDYPLFETHKTIQQKLKSPYKGVMISSEWRLSESLKGRHNTSQISCPASSDLCWQRYSSLVVKSVPRNCSAHYAGSVRRIQLTCLYSRKDHNQVCSLTHILDSSLIAMTYRESSNPVEKSHFNSNQALSIA